MRRAVVAAALLCALDAAAKCAPKNVLKTVVTEQVSGAAPLGSITVYRTGALYGRIEARDDDDALNLLFVVNGADVWLVKDGEETGQHIVDASGDPGFAAPIIGEVQSQYWGNFEYGCEEPFMKAVGAAPHETPDGGKVYEHSKEGTTARLFVGKDGLPKRIELTVPAGEYAVLYQTFEELNDPPKDLFEKPAGIAFTEQKE